MLIVSCIVCFECYESAVSKLSLELLAVHRVSLMVNNTWQWIHSALSDVVSVTVGWRSHLAANQRPDDKSNNSISLAVTVSRVRGIR